MTTLRHSTIWESHSAQAEMCASATELFNGLAAILLIDTTSCGIVLRAVLQDNADTALEDLRQRYSRDTAKRPEQHWDYHFRAVLAGLTAVNDDLRVRGPSRQGRLHGQLKSAARHLEAIASSGNRGALFDMSACCGGVHGEMAVSA